MHDLFFERGGGTQIYWCTDAWTKKHIKGGLFCSTTHKTRFVFRGLKLLGFLFFVFCFVLFFFWEKEVFLFLILGIGKCPFSRKRGSFCQSWLKSLSSNLFRDQMWYKIAKTPLFRGVFAWRDKTCLGVSFRSDVHHVYTLTSECPPPPGFWSRSLNGPGGFYEYFFYFTEGTIIQGGKNVKHFSWSSRLFLLPFHIFYEWSSRSLIMSGVS